MDQFPILDNIQCLLPIIQNPTAKFSFLFPSSKRKDPVAPVPRLFDLVPEAFGSFVRLRERCSQPHCQVDPSVEVSLRGGETVIGKLEFFDQRLNMFLGECTVRKKEFVRCDLGVPGRKIENFGCLSKAAKRRMRRKWKEVAVVEEHLRLFVPGGRVVFVRLLE